MSRCAGTIDACDKRVEVQVNAYPQGYFKDRDELRAEKFFYDLILSLRLYFNLPAHSESCDSHCNILSRFSKEIREYYIKTDILPALMDGFNKLIFYDDMHGG